MFYNVLTNKLNYSLDKRYHFYHILVHNYLKLSELNEEHISKTLFKIIYKYNKNIIENDIENIVSKENINGIKLKQIVTNNDYKKLMQIFNGLNIKINEWIQIHNVLKVWMEIKYIRINYKRII